MKKGLSVIRLSQLLNNEPQALISI